VHIFANFRSNPVMKLLELHLGVDLGRIMMDDGGRGALRLGRRGSFAATVAYEPAAQCTQ